MSTCKQAIQNRRSGGQTKFSFRKPAGRSNTNKVGLYCLLIVSILLLNPAVGRSQWWVDSGYRFGFATSVAGPTLSSGTVLNPALIRGKSVSLSLSDEFGLSELRSGFASVVFSRNRFSYGFQSGSFGYSLYREWHGGGSIAFALKNYRLGASIVADHVSIPNYGGGTAISLRLGALLKLSDVAQFGINGDRILIKKFGPIDNFIPFGWTAAISWNWIKSGILGLAVQSIIGNSPIGSVLMRWNLHESLNFSLAHEPVTGRWAIGMRIHFKQWSIPLGGTFHGDLGWSRHLGVGWIQESIP